MNRPTTTFFTLSAPLYPGSAAQPGLIPGHWLALGLAFSILCVGALLWDAGMTINPRTPSSLIFSAFAALALGLRYAMRAPASPAQRVARDLSESVGLFTGIALLGAVATYPLAADTRGSIDPLLQQIDVALRFDWLAWYRAVAAHRTLQVLGTAAYQSIFVTPALILGYCAWADKRTEGRAFLASFWVAAVLCLLLFRYLPAVGPLATLWHGPVPYLPESALYEAELIPQLRAHALLEIDLGSLRGLVSAPSFHTASAVLYIAAGWPLLRLRGPVVVLSTAMLLATPVEGTHYLADMLIGAAVAGAALALVAKVRRHLAARGR